MKKVILIAVVVVLLAAIGIYVYFDYQNTLERRNPRFYSGNGRLEATEVYVAAKLAGRIDKLYVNEGDLVKKGDKLVQMQTNVLEAEKASIIAQIKVQEGELGVAHANVKLKQSAFDGANKEFKRQKELLTTHATSQQHYDAAETQYNKTLADLESAKASVIAAEGRVAEQKAELQRVQENINDSTLYATYDGRIQYVLAREGEVMSAGGRVLNLVNLTDVYLTFFLPTDIAGKVDLYSQVKIILDARPDYAFNAKVTFVDPVAQFTPKSVETKLEREKLMFRIKAHLDPKLLNEKITKVKTGLPGVGWVKLDKNASWKDCSDKVAAKEE